MSKLPTKKSARFRKLLPVVEAKLEEGYSYEEVAEILNRDYNLDLTLGVFRNYLYKERKNQNKQAADNVLSNETINNTANQAKSQITNKESETNLQAISETNAPKSESDGDKDLSDYFSTLKKDIEKERERLSSNQLFLNKVKLWKLQF